MTSGLPRRPSLNLALSPPAPLRWRTAPRAHQCRTRQDRDEQVAHVGAGWSREHPDSNMPPPAPPAAHAMPTAHPAGLRQCRSAPHRAIPCRTSPRRSGPSLPHVRHDDLHRNVPPRPGMRRDQPVAGLPRLQRRRPAVRARRALDACRPTQYVAMAGTAALRAAIAAKGQTPTARPATSSADHRHRQPRSAVQLR